MAGKVGALRGIKLPGDVPWDEHPPAAGGILVSSTEAGHRTRWLGPKPNDPDHPSLSSFMYQNGGVYVGKRALDRFKGTITSNRTICVFGDSLAQAAVKGADGWPERLARILGTKYGPRLTAGAGYYGLYRSGSTGGFTNTDREWTVGANSGFAALLATDTAALGPNLCAMKATAAARQDRSCTTTANSRTVTCATAAAADLGALVTGTGIPPNTYIVFVTVSTSVILSRPANAAGTNTLQFHKSVISWTRPIATNNIGVQVFDAITVNTDATVTSATANFKSMHTGQMVTGANVPANSTVSLINSDSSIELSAAATGTTNGGELVIHDGRTVTDNATTSGSATITSNNALFSAQDVFCKVVGTNIPAGTYILRVISQRQAVLSANASGTGSSLFLFIQNNQNGRAVSDMATTAFSATVTSATAAFSPADVGRPVVGANIPGNTFIQSVTNSTTAVLTNNIPVTTTGCDLRIGAYSALNVTEVQLLWVNNVSGNGASFLYSLDGGRFFTSVTQSATGTPRLEALTIPATNPESVIVCAELAAGTASQTVQTGLFAFERSSSAFSGFRLFNISRDAQSLAVMCQGGVGDQLAILDTGNGAYTGLFPDLIIVLFTNDSVSAFSSEQKFWNAMNRIMMRTGSDIIFVQAFEQAIDGVFGRNYNSQRSLANSMKKACFETPIPYVYANDVSLTSGVATITSATISFSVADVGKTVRGDGIPAGTIISSITSVSVATMSANATANVTNGFCQIMGTASSTGYVVIDWYEALRAQGLRGYEDANIDGLMVDTVHQTQLAHNDLARRIGSLLEVYG
jgi:hypothetical protein